MAEVTKSDGLSPENYHPKCLLCHVIAPGAKPAEVGSASTEAAEMQSLKPCLSCQGRGICPLPLDAGKRDASTNSSRAGMKTVLSGKREALE